MNSNNRTKPRRVRPKFQFWNLATPTAGARIFQSVGAIVSLFLIGSVGAQFTATYAALLTCIIVSIVSPAFVLTFSFDLQRTTRTFDWMFWELIYSCAGSFLFFISSFTMTYSSFRWHHTTWYISAVICFLVTCAFFVDAYICVRCLCVKPSAKHSQDLDHSPLPTQSSTTKATELS